MLNAAKSNTRSSTRPHSWSRRPGRSSPCLKNKKQDIEFYRLLSVNAQAVRVVVAVWKFEYRGQKVCNGRDKLRWEAEGFRLSISIEVRKPSVSAEINTFHPPPSPTAQGDDEEQLYIYVNGYSKIL